MNILVVHEISWLRDPVFEIHTLSELLSLRGHNVYAIDYRQEQGVGLVSHYQEIDIAKAYPQAKVRLIRPSSIKIPVLSRISYSFMYNRAIYRVLRDREIDAVMLYAVPTSGVQTIQATKLLGVPVIFRSIDILHQLVDSPVLARITHQMEKWVYRRADLVLSINQSLKRYVVALGASQHRCRVLPLGVDTDIFRPAPPDKELREQLGLTDKDKVITFAGTLPKFSGLDVLIKAMPDVVRAIPDARLLIVGDGVQRPELEMLVRELGLGDKVKITGMVPHDDVPRYVNLASVCVMPFRVYPTTDDIFPTKVVQYMACGKPVVSSPLKGLKEEGLGEREGVLYTDMGNPLSGILNAMVNQIGLGERAREYAVKVHGYGSVVERLENEIRELVDRRKQ